MRRYEFVEGGSSKFWEISLEGASFTTHWGRIGTAGQRTTKTFASEAAAKTEHDRLVAEKVQKGYRATEGAGGGSEKLPPPAAASGIREDVFLDNDGGGFGILSAGVVERVIADGRADDMKFTRAHEAISVQLVGDDSLLVRVVCGGPLEPAEAEEWIARIRWPLEVSGGKLLITAGGLDPDGLALWQSGEDDGSYYGFPRQVAVPDGKYLASIHNYLHSMNGRVFLEDQWQEKLGAWFRRDHENRPFPSWVAAELHRSPEEDPGHEKAWEKLAASVEKKKLVVELDPLDWIDFLIHLEPFDAEAELSEPGEDGWFAPTTGLRKPARFPLGIASRTAETPSYRYELKELLPAPEPAATAPIETVDVAARVDDRALTPVRGGPVEHPIAKLEQVYRLAWLATDAADPEIRIVAGDDFELAWEKPIVGVQASPTDGGFRIGFAPSGAKWTQMAQVRQVAERLGQLPDGATLELMTAHAPDPKQHRDLGVQRYRGEVKKGIWRIAATYPELDKKLLREALDFSAAIDEGKALPLRDEAEGAKALELSRADEVLFKQNPILVRKGRIGFAKKDPGLLHFVAGYVFRRRWSNTWPCYVEPPEDVQAAQDFRAKMKELGATLGDSLSKAAAPKGARELVLEGKVGKFEKIDLAKERPGEAEILASADRQLAALGFRLLGELVCSRFQDVLVRGYAREGGDAWGLLISGVLRSSFDFVTRFEKDAVLTTTLTNGASKDEPEKGVYRSRHPDLGLDKLEKLHEKHVKRKVTLSKKLGGPVPTEATLLALAKAIDHGVAQQLGL